MNNRETLYQHAIVFLNAGNFIDAERSFRNFLKSQPKHVGALNLLTVVLMGLERYGEAEEFIRTAVKISQSSDVSFYNYGIILKKLGRPREALEKFSIALRLKPEVSETWNNRGTVFNDLREYQRAISDFDKAIALNQNYADAHANKGKSLGLVKRHNGALAAYDKALALKPDLADAWLGRGNVFTELKRYDEAFTDYDRALTLKPDLVDAWLGRGNVFAELKRHDEAFAAYDKALTLKPDLAEAWLGRGNVFAELKRYDEAFAAYDKALALKPDLADAWLGRGNVFAELKRYDEAFAAYDKALALKPDLAEAWLGRGNVFYDLKRYDEAFAAPFSYDKALALKPDLAEAWLGRGSVFNELKRYDEAFAAYDKAFSLKPELVGVEGSRLHAKMHLCDWSNFDAECNHLIASVRDGKSGAPPFTFLAIPSSPDDQLQCAKLWVAEKCPPSQKPVWQNERYKHERIRVAYVSADFYEHATSQLMAGMFECHDKSRFELTAISIGRDDNSQMRQRLNRSFDHFINAEILSDEEIASCIRETEIDILIDLKGFTQDARTNVFSSRPAPIQVSYLGYPGTMGAPYIDYIIADQTVIPDEFRKFYSEKIVVLPNSYQANDRNRFISDKAFFRPDVGLPSQGFVFCCFNNNYKIVPRVFDCWMQILKQVEGSVLWLLEGASAASNNLKKEASARGISSERLIFAKRMPLPEHLARHKLADLFLDTLPYNAHTTASDALWAGLPVLTCIGETFSGRVAASLLNAIHLPELITTTTEAYEQMAIDLAAHPEKLAAIKYKLAENRLTTPLFDTKLFTKHIEAAYTEMYRRYQAELEPNQIVLSD